MRPRIYLSFSPQGRALYYGDRALAGLRELGALRLNEAEALPSPAALAEAVQDCEVLVADRRIALDAGFFAAAPRLVAVLRCAMDIRTIDVAAASEHGVLVTRASAGFANAVAEWTMAALLDLARGVSASVQAYRGGGLPPVAMGRELRGSTLGVIGYGVIGRRLCELAKGFGLQVVVHDPLAPVDDPALANLSLDALLAASDHVVCLAPATPNTENLMDGRRFAAMKRGAVFVNPSRGNLVDEAALRAALDAGHLAGAALDVGRAPDQMPSPELARHPKVIATPHIGGLTPPAVEHQALETVEQLRTLLAGGMPVGAVNPADARRLASLQAA